MYNYRQFFAEYLIGGYAIGDRDDLAFKRDGSLDLYVQREAPEFSVSLENPAVIFVLPSGTADRRQARALLDRAGTMVVAS